MGSAYRVLDRRAKKGFLLRWTFVLASVSFALLVQSDSSNAKVQSVPDNDEFAEFDFDEEEFEMDDGKVGNKKHQQDGGKSAQEEAEVGFEDDDDDEAVVEDDMGVQEEDDEEEAVVEDEDDEFEHFQDDEEFENVDPTETKDKRSSSSKGGEDKQQGVPKTIKIANVPARFINSWENYYLEILMAAGILVYFVNFFTGKSKNARVASAWFDSHKELLESNFALVGDDGAKDLDDVETQLVKESEHGFVLWCSGRLGCESMLVDIKLLKRQDLVSVMSNMMKPAHDQVQIRVNMNSDEMDTFVFCLAGKKATAARLSKEMMDISTFCPEKRSAEKYGVPAKFVLMSEMAEVAAGMIDAKMTAMLNKYPDAIDFIHFSDQYTGPKPTDDQQPVDLPEGKKVLIFCFNVLLKGEKGSARSIEDAVEDMRPLMLLVFYFVDKVRRYKLSREAKNKAEKNRAKVNEAFWKSIHAARAEKAAEEREKKRREMKERIMEIEDPDKQRKMEASFDRKDKKRNAPKMKQLKMKAM